MRTGQLPLKFCVLFHKGRKDIGQPLPGSVWYDARPPCELEAAILQFQLTDKQREMGYCYSVRPIAQSYRPLWKPMIRATPLKESCSKGSSAGGKQRQ